MDRLLYCWCKTETPTLRRGGLTWPTVSEISVSVGSKARQQRDVAEEAAQFRVARKQSVEERQRKGRGNRQCPSHSPESHPATLGPGFTTLEPMRRPPQLNCHTDLLVHSELHVPVHVLNSPLFFCCCRRRPHTLPSLFSCLHPQVGLGVCEHVPSRGGHLLLSESAASCASVLTLCQTSCSANSTPPT